MDDRQIPKIKMGNIHGSLFTALFIDGGFIGGYDMYLDNTHRWLDGTLVASGYAPWHHHDPGHGNEKYMAFRLSEEIFFDVTDTYVSQYICQAGLI